jgi:hypothetical protein
VTLSWHDRSHWARVEAPCRWCHQPTWLRDDDRLPAHKVCAEQAAEREQQKINDRYQQGRDA